jgi:hypothetical protein
MYYPYLRGKQFELLALREFADSYFDNCLVFPVIEPVKNSFNSMKIAINKLQEKNISFALILNPQVGDMFHKTEQIESELVELLTDRYKWTPAFIVNTNAVGILGHIRDKAYKHVMLICEDSVDTNNPIFDELINLPEVHTVLINADNRSLKRKLDRINKVVVRFDDKFKPQKRNADYLEIPEERFTEEHCYYEADGFVGFSDYTVLQSDFTEGGRLPYAVAIHLTYEKDEEEVWVRHFVSDTNDDNTNIQGKFGEAVEKAVRYFERLPYSNNSIHELSTYYREGQYPGLGILKKVSIKNHLELMNGILTSKVL